MKFREDQWIGNKWASIDIEPVDANCFLPILFHLANTYRFPFPPVIDCIDGYAADFEIMNSKVTILVDCWTFSITFEQNRVRDYVVIALQAWQPSTLVNFG